MRLLADESCDFRVVRALRDAGHDVLAVILSTQGFENEIDANLLRLTAPGETATPGSSPAVRNASKSLVRVSVFMVFLLKVRHTRD